MFEVTKEFKFEASHVLSNYDGLCGNLHGHSYKCLITIKGDKLGTVEEESMVMDFNKIKSLLNCLFDKLDHSFLCNIHTSDNFEKEIINLCEEYGKKIVYFNTRTTAEEMSKSLFVEVNKLLIDNNFTEVKCSKVQLFETLTGNCVYSED